jgi:Ca2+-binding EF-hand superfamily protein
MTQKLIALAGMSLLAGSVSTGAFAAYISQRTNAAAESDARQLMRMMDRDQNGAVSKGEFLAYMSGIYDHLDVNGNRRLEPSEVRHFPRAVKGSRHTHGS